MSESARVLHLSAGNLYGGVETLLITLARHWALCPEMTPEFGLCFRGRIWEELTECGVMVHDMGSVRFSRPWTVWRARRGRAGYSVRSGLGQSSAILAGRTPSSPAPRGERDAVWLTSITGFTEVWIIKNSQNGSRSGRRRMY